MGGCERDLRSPSGTEQSKTRGSTPLVGRYMSRWCRSGVRDGREAADPSAQLRAEPPMLHATPLRAAHDYATAPTTSSRLEMVTRTVSTDIRANYTRDLQPRPGESSRRAPPTGGCTARLAHRYCPGKIPPQVGNTNRAQGCRGCGRSEVKRHAREKIWLLSPIRSRDDQAAISQGRPCPAWPALNLIGSYRQEM